MNPKPDLPEKLGRSLNELDIDFSNFTVTGWLVSVAALLTGSVIAGALAWLLIRKNGINVAAGMTFCFAMLIVTTATFIGLRKVIERLGYQVTRTK